MAARSAAHTDTSTSEHMFRRFCDGCGRAPQNGPARRDRHPRLRVRVAHSGHPTAGDASFDFTGMEPLTLVGPCGTVRRARCPDDPDATTGGSARGRPQHVPHSRERPRLIGFGGVAGRTSSQSEPWWPEEKSAPPGAPNIVVVLIDDMGYSDIGPFGAEIDTPNLDRLAHNGIRLSNYHTTPVCSPARAALLTGLNPHRAGYGSVANSDPGLPGLRLELADDVLALPEILVESGLRDLRRRQIGIWSATRTWAPDGRESWPLQRGFDSYYGSLEGLNSFFYPNQLIADNSVVDVEAYPRGLLRHRRSHRSRHRADQGAARAGSRQTVLPVLRPHRDARTASGEGPDLAKYRGRYVDGAGMQCDNANFER